MFHETFVIDHPTSTGSIIVLTIITIIISNIIIIIIILWHIDKDQIPGRNRLQYYGGGGVG